MDLTQKKTNNTVVAVFKTTVEDTKDTKKIRVALEKEFSDSRISFDLEDSDNILRVEADSLNVRTIKDTVAQHKCEAVLIKKADILI